MLEEGIRFIPDKKLISKGRYTGKKLEEIGKEFNIDNYSTVSSVICKIDRQIKTNSHLQKKADQIRIKMNKGQKQT